MANYRLLVSPQTMKDQAVELQSEIEGFIKDWEKIKTTIEKSKSYWQGKGSTSHQKFVPEYEDDFNKAFKNFRMRPEELTEVSGIFTETEQSLVTLVNSLPDSILE